MELLYIQGLWLYIWKFSSTNLDTFSEFFNSSKMRKDLVMSNFVRLFGWISWGTFEDFKWRAPSWSFLAFWITRNTIYRWLVKCCPVLHPISKILKAEFRKIPEILSTFTLIKQLKNCFFGHIKIHFQDYFTCKITYTILSSTKPPYSISRANGDSQWKRVTEGWISVNY